MQSYFTAGLGYLQRVSSLLCLQAGAGVASLAGYQPGAAMMAKLGRFEAFRKLLGRLAPYIGLEKELRADFGRLPDEALPDLSVFPALGLDDPYRTPHEVHMAPFQVEYLGPPHTRIQGHSDDRLELRRARLEETRFLLRHKDARFGGVLFREELDLLGRIPPEQSPVNGQAEHSLEER